jgi:hypothetical protein
MAEAVAGWLKHTESCGHHDQSSVTVSGENEFTIAMRLHPADTEEATNTMGRARGEVRGVQRMNCAVGDLA